MGKHKTENADLRKLVIASHEKLTKLSEKEDEIVRLREKLADAMVKFGEVAESKDLQIQQLTQQVQAMELKAVELKSVVKEEHLLQESLAEKDAVLVELTLKMENMTAAFGEKKSDAKQTKLESKFHLDAFNPKMHEELAGQNEEVERVFGGLEVQGEELQDTQEKLHEMEEELQVSRQVV